MVSSVDLPVTGEITEATRARPYLCLVVSVEPALIYEVLQIPGLQVGAGAQAGVYVGRAEPRLNDAIARLARCLDSSSGERAVLVPGILREIVYRLLCG